MLVLLATKLQIMSELYIVTTFKLNIGFHSKLSFLTYYWLTYTSHMEVFTMWTLIIVSDTYSGIHNA